MTYIYGTSTRNGAVHENLKTVDVAHSDLFGYIKTVRELGDGTKITDHCHIVKKYASMESNGQYYDWYIIDNHYQETDNSKKVQGKLDQLTANLDYISMMSGVDIPTEGGVFNG